MEYKIKNGFTIIELIVVVAVIAIMAAIVMANIVIYIQKSQMIGGLAELHQISSLAQDFYSNNGYFGIYPGNSGLFKDSRLLAIGNSIKKTTNNVYGLLEYDRGGILNCAGLGSCSVMSNNNTFCNNDKWVAGVNDHSNNVACIDFTGYSIANTSIPTSTFTTSCSCGE